MYEITRDYIKFGKARSGKQIDKVKFIVAHDTGNPGSTAYANRKYFNDHQPAASAHTFIDDKYILEIIPLYEKAWHVQYQKPYDNRLFGDDANDAAIGVELCWGGNINFEEAYKRFVWYHAYLCDAFNLDPRKHIVGHYTLDPERRTDPINAFKRYGITWAKFINDVVKVFESEFQKTKTVDRDEQVKSETVVNVIRLGDKGKHVKEIQEKLILLGFPLPRYGADGHFGKETLESVKAFQAKYKLAVDGIVGPKTLQKLNEVYEQQKRKIPYPGFLIKRGSKGKYVEMVQKVVGVKVDGIFGPKTEAAVKAFQKKHGLRQDGIVGPETWAKMF
jgi:N-acetylmuramoyl-L-alanine amidase